MASPPNPQLDLAFEYIKNTNQNIFLTGKAGTGKTTFLNQIRRETTKRMVVTAPTGVAAINAGGMTIHSFFQLPFGPIVPGAPADQSRQRQFRTEKIALIRSLDLLVIDEISMVRADVLDGIDGVLRRFRDHFKPFGGVQLLMIGDLHQLPPIVKDEEWSILRPHYASAYFFESKNLRESKYITIELKHIYRQSDSLFIDLLNKVRDNRLDAEVLEKLNSRFVPNFQPTEAEPYITLTAHNATAQAINQEKLDALAGKMYDFRAKIEGDFPAHAYPTDETLSFKIGAQVMFVKNDVTRDKRFFNGKIGKITRIEGELIFVKCPGDAAEIEAAPVGWDNVKYNLDEKTKEVNEEILGSFTQFPLKLAWAITIHKSQGLTFDRAIIDAQAAFAHGQVYVALSRCKTFEGIVLRSKIQLSSVKTDAMVKNYSAEADKNAPDEAHLFRAKIDFQQKMLLDLFDFLSVKKAFNAAERAFLENEKSLLPGAAGLIPPIKMAANAALFEVSERFKNQVRGFFDEKKLPEETPDLQDRVKKAADYFLKKITDEISPELQKVRIETDNKAVKKDIREAIDQLKKVIFLKKTGFEACLGGFDSQKMLRAVANADLDFSKNLAAQTAPATPLSKPTGHSKLFEALKSWRVIFADQHGTEPHFIVPTKTLLAIAEAVPTSVAELKRIPGLGKVKINFFGPEIVAIVREFATEPEAEIEPSDIVLPQKSPKIDTKQASFDLFKNGKTIDEIAAERGLTRSTIEGHLAHFVQLGKLDLSEIIEPERAVAIETYLLAHPDVALSDARLELGEAFSYGEIRLVLAAMKGREVA